MPQPPIQSIVCPRGWPLRLVLCATLLLAALMGQPAVASNAGQVVVIAHPDAPGQLSRGALRAAFGMRLRSWEDGRPIRVFVLHDGEPLHGEFVKRWLDIFPHQLRLAWDRQIFTGTGQGPATVADEAALLDAVARTPGAIGYARGLQAEDRVRVVAIHD